MYDQHLHSRHSFDSKADPAENVRSAIARGLSGLTFTEHYDTHPDEVGECVYDDGCYSETIAGLRREFGDRIFIGKGIEVCYQPDHMPVILDFLYEHKFDLVLLSVHWSEGRPVHKPGAWEGRDPGDVTRRYLERVLEAVRFCEVLHRDGPRRFDVLGHLDFCKRYSQRFAGSTHVHECGDIVDEILRCCLAADVVPEINTSTLRRGLDESMPGPWVISRYAALGGTMVSVGSDAHVSEDIGAGFDVAREMADRAGLKGWAVFKDGERSMAPMAGSGAVR
jgi:histidinol-phosphatase (PHP family)